MIKFDGTGHCEPQGLVTVAAAEVNIKLVTFHSENDEKLPVVDEGTMADVEGDLVKVVDAEYAAIVVEVALLEVVVFFGP